MESLWFALLKQFVRIYSQQNNRESGIMHVNYSKRIDLYLFNSHNIITQNIASRASRVCVKAELHSNEAQAIKTMVIKPKMSTV